MSEFHWISAVVGDARVRERMPYFPATAKGADA